MTKLGKRIKAEHLGFMLDIHYSDTWADPGAQRKPRAWENLEFPALVEQTRVYSRDVIVYLRENGALPDMVQIGNETRNGLLYGDETNGAGPQLGGGFWEKTPGGRDRAVQLLSAGLQGVKQGAVPDKTPQTIIHVPDGQNPQFTARLLPRFVCKRAQTEYRFGFRHHRFVLFIRLIRGTKNSVTKVGNWSVWSSQ